MKHFAISFWLWLPATIKAGLMVFVSMATAFTAYVKTPANLDAFTRGDWIFCGIIVAIAGSTALIAFLDRTMETIKAKAGDTMLFYAGDRRADK